MPELQGDVTIEFEAYCQRCSRGMCGNVTVYARNSKGMPYINIDPCETCEDAAVAEADDKAYDRGYCDGKEETPNG